MPRVSLWDPWVLIPAGILTAVIGLCVFLQTASRKRRYTGEAQAEVLSVARSSHHTKYRTIHTYKPKLAYTIDGNRYEVNGQDANREDFYQPGATITVRYNPNKPNKCLSIPEGETKRGAFITMALGGGIALLGVIALLTR